MLSSSTHTHYTDVTPHTLDWDAVVFVLLLLNTTKVFVCLFVCSQDDCRVVLAKQEINRLLETLQKQQQQFTEMADHVQLDAGIPVTFTKVNTQESSRQLLSTEYTGNTEYYI